MPSLNCPSLSSWAQNRNAHPQSLKPPSCLYDIRPTLHWLSESLSQLSMTAAFFRHQGQSCSWRKERYCLLSAYWFIPTHPSAFLLIRNCKCGCGTGKFLRPSISWWPWGFPGQATPKETCYSGLGCICFPSVVVSGWAWCLVRSKCSINRFWIKTGPLNLNLVT